MANSISRVRPAKPQGSPLYPHSSGQWAKKVRGKLRYFGKWDDHDAALERYNRERVFLELGLPVPERVDGLTVRDLANIFLTAQKRRMGAGEISERHFADLLKTCKRVADCFDPDRAVSTICPDDFTRLRREWDGYAPATITGHVTRTKILFRWAWKSDKLDNAPRFGPEFRAPSKRVARVYRNNKPARFFDRDELLTMLLAAGEPLEAMILLGVNCAMGNHDVATLELPSVDLVGGWLNFPRGKTGINRRVPLWPETIEALAEAIADRAEGSVFITRWGNAWNGHAVSQAMRKLLKNLGIDREGVAFYSLRHVFQTVGGNSRDRDAVSAIMGHVDSSMAGHYREGIPDERLRGVTDVVRSWLFGEAQR